MKRLFALALLLPWLACADGLTINGLIPANNLSDLASASTSRTNLGLGTAATQNTGTSGATLCLLNAASCTFSNTITFNASHVDGTVETDVNSATWTVTTPLIVCNKGTAMTETAPASGWAIGQHVEIANLGAGACTVDSGAAHLIGAPGAQTKILNQGDTLTMWCQAVSSGACTQFLID